MSGETPSRHQADKALAEAAGRAAAVRRTDRPFARALLTLAVLYLLVGVLVGLVGAGPGGGVALIAVFAVGLAVLVIVLVRVRAVSRTGARLYAAGIVAVSLWNAVVVTGSMWLGWWAPATPGWHFTVSAMVSALPLLAVAGVLFGRSR